VGGWRGGGEWGGVALGGGGGEGGGVGGGGGGGKSNSDEGLRSERECDKRTVCATASIA